MNEGSSQMECWDIPVDTETILGKQGCGSYYHSMISQIHYDFNGKTPMTLPLTPKTPLYHRKPFLIPKRPSETFK